MRIFAAVMFLFSFAFSFSIFSDTNKIEQLYGVYFSPPSDPFDENSTDLIVISKENEIIWYEKFDFEKFEKYKIKILNQELCVYGSWGDDWECMKYIVKDNGDLALLPKKAEDVLLFNKIF